MYLLGYHLSVATGVGFIALAGVAAEFGVVMLLYLKHALADRLAAGAAPTAQVVDDAIREVHSVLQTGEVHNYGDEVYHNVKQLQRNSRQQRVPA